MNKILVRTLMSALVAVAACAPAADDVATPPGADDAPSVERFDPAAPTLDFGLARAGEAQRRAWSRAFRSRTPWKSSVATDEASGAVVVSLQTSQPTDFGAGEVAARGYLVAFEADGSLRWARPTKAPFRVRIDREGRVVSAHDGVGASGGLVEARDVDGRLRWSRRFALAAIQHLAVDAVGNCYVAVNPGAPVDLRTGELSADGAARPTVLSLSAAGELRWTWAPPTGQVADLDVASDTVTAVVSSSDAMGGSTLRVVALRGDGTTRWSRDLDGASPHLRVGAAALSAEGEVYVAGSFGAELTVEGAAPLTARSSAVMPDGRDDFLLALSRTGETRWVRHIHDGLHGLSVRDMALGRGGALHLYGAASGVPTTSRRIDGALIEGADLALATVNADDGSPGALRRFATRHVDDPGGLAVHRDGSPVVTGWAPAPIDFGDGPVGGDGDDVFVAKLAM